MSRFPSRDLRAQNRCVLKRSARRRRSKIIDTRARAKITFPFERVVLPFGRAFSSLYSTKVDSSYGIQNERESKRFIHPERYKTGKKTRYKQQRDIETQTYFLTVLLTENAYSPTGSCDRTLIDSRLLLFSSSSFWDTTASSLLVVGAAPTFVPPRTDRDISSSSSSRDPFVFALWKACLALSTLLYKGVASSSSSSSSFFFVSSTTFKSRTTKVFSRRLKRTQL